MKFFGGVGRDTINPQQRPKCKSNYIQGMIIEVDFSSFIFKNVCNKHNLLGVIKKNVYKLQAFDQDDFNPFYGDNFRSPHL